jgi:fructose-1,6-bisphosphatase I
MMADRRTTFSKFIIESLRRREGADPELAALLNDVMTACKLIAAAVSRGAAEAPAEARTLDAIASDLMLGACEFGGQLCGALSEELEQPYAIPEGYPRGRYLLAFDPLDGASNIDVNMPAGTIFSVLRAPEGITDPAPADFLQPGTRQVAAGYALYGPSSMLVVTLGDGVHGFRLEREIGAFMLTHPDLRIPEATLEFAINASNARFWEPPVRRYVEECVAGREGHRGEDFSMRWIASMVSDVHRILLRGGMFLDPRDTRDTSRLGRVRLLTAANPLAMIVEQAGGAATTGRHRVLDIAPGSLAQVVPLMLGSRREVERVQRYHAAYDAGEPLNFVSPLFNTRSLFRSM